MEIRYGKDIRILIVGGGIAGLTLAALLQQRGFKPHIVEKVHEYKPVGYVISLWPCGTRILKGLSLYEKLLDQGEAYIQELKGNEQGEILATYSYDSIIKDFGPIIGVYRSDLVDILRSQIPSQLIETGRTIQAIQEKTDGVVVTFSDGKEQIFDLVVGCDGLHSKVRELIFPSQPLNYSGSYGWAFWVPPTIPLKNKFVEYYANDGRYFGIYPAKKRLCAFTGIIADKNLDDNPETRIEKIKHHFKSFGGFVPQILEELEIKTPIVPTPFYSLCMDSWRTKRIILIGDAGHAILPSAGLGASMAMESAAVLAEELTRTDSEHLESMLDRFEARRRPRVERIRKLSDFSYDPANPPTLPPQPMPVQLPSQEQVMAYVKDIISEPI